MVPNERATPADSASVSSFDLLAVMAAALGALWTLLALWVVADRTRYDRAQVRAATDLEGLTKGVAGAGTLSRRRLRRLALGTEGAAATLAAAELVRRDGPRLHRTAAARSRTARMRALALLARGRDAGAAALIRDAIDADDAGGATTGLLRLVSELPTADADVLLLEVLVAGRLSRSRTATELEPRTVRVRQRLIVLTRADDPEIRYWAVTLLGRLMDRVTAARAVRARAADESASVRAAVAEALGFAPAGSATEPLRELLVDDVFYVRSHAARAVAQSRDESLADDLAPLLADRNWWVRAAAKEALQALGDTGLAVALAALSHSDAFARDGALEVIASSGHLVDLNAVEEHALEQLGLAVAEVA
jgi:HEAT repeat protein